MTERLWKITLIAHSGTTFQVVCAKKCALSFVEEYEGFLDDNTFRLVGVTDTSDRATTVVVMKKSDVLGVVAYEI